MSDVMREMTVREANQNFSQVVAAAERGETIVITKNATPVAKISPQAADRGSAAIRSLTGNSGHHWACEVCAIGRQ